ncbi:MAG: SIMPL domain-containing protein [Patescibacteria group bacterium]
MSPTSKLWLTGLLALAFGAFGLNQLFLSGVSYKNFAHWQKPGNISDTITVTGEGKVTAVPDIGLISLSVENRGANVIEVQKEGTKKMNEIINYLKAQDIDKKDIRTTQYNLNPIYAYDRDSGQQKFDGYQLSQSVEVKIRNLAKVGEIIAGASGKGANQIGQLTFSVDEPEQYQQQARIEAIAKAKAKAEAMARAAGISLGKVKSFSENINSPMNYPMMYARNEMEIGGGLDKAPAPQVEAGSQEVIVNVSLSYEIN